MKGRRIRIWVWVVVFLSSPVWTYAQQDQPAVSGSASGGSAVAAVPRLIKFSGEVRDARGEPLGSVAVRAKWPRAAHDGGRRQSRSAVADVDAPHGRRDSKCLKPCLAPLSC
jgi:hypothetical protein